MRQVFAIQAQDTVAADLGIRVRGQDLTAHAIRAAYEDDRTIVRNWFMRGTLHTIPTRHSKRLVVLDRLAQSFEPGQRYDEAEVNLVLRRVHPDHAALRRYLVENGFLTREAGVYWRSGGTVDV